jgi:hypothetical protein
MAVDAGPGVSGPEVTFRSAFLACDDQDDQQHHAADHDHIQHRHPRFSPVADMRGRTSDGLIVPEDMP